MSDPDWDFFTPEFKEPPKRDWDLVAVWCAIGLTVLYFAAQIVRWAL